MKRRVLLVVVLIATAAVAILTRFPSSKSLSKSLVSTDDSARNMALSQLDGLDGEKKSKLVDELLAKTGDPDSQKRVFALYALRKTGVDKEKIFPVVIKALDDEESRVRQEAMIGLSEMGTEFAPKLLNLLPEKSASAQGEIIKALVTMGKPALPHFESALKSGNAIVRAHTATILGLSSPKIFEALPSLGPLLKDSDPLVRRYVVSPFCRL